VVDEYLADPVPRPTRRNETLRDRSRHVRDDGVREALDGVPVVHLAQGHHDVQALAAAGLQVRREAELIQERTHQIGRFLNLLPRHPLPRVQVEHHAVRVPEGFRAGVQGVELDHVPRRRRQQALLAHHVRHRRMADVERGVELPNARQLVGVGMLPEEQLAAHAVGRTQPGHGPAPEVGHHQLTDEGVATQQVDLGRAAAGVDDAVGVGDVQP